MTAFKFFSVDGDKGNVLPFHIFFYFVFYGDFYGVIRLVWVRTGSEIGEKLSEWSNGLFMYVGMITGNLELLVLANRAINTPKSRHTRERSSEEEKKGLLDTPTGVLGNQWTSFVVYDEKVCTANKSKLLHNL